MPPPGFLYRLHRVLTRASNIVLPLVCPSCQRHLSAREPWPLCPSCRRRIEWIAPPLCRDCGQPVQSGELCAACLAERTPTPLCYIRSAARYAADMRTLIHKAKYNQRSELLPLLHIPLIACAADCVSSPSDTVFVPVPLHPKRLAQRGYNLPDQLAHLLAWRFGARYRPLWLKRLRDTPPQVRLNWEARQQNMDGAFATPKSDLSGLRVIVVDDVATTGATLSAAAAPLRAAGAECIGLTLARAQKTV